MGMRTTAGFEGDEPDLGRLDREVEGVPDQETAPLPDECLPCYLYRMVDTQECERDFRWVHRWQHAQLARLAGLDDWLNERGGHCDCEVLYYAFRDFFGGEPPVGGLPPCTHGPLARPQDARDVAGRQLASCV